MSNQDVSKLPTPKEFFLEVPLYKKYKYNESNFEKLFNLEYFRGTIDIFCIWCNKESTFKANISINKKNAETQTKTLLGLINTGPATGNISIIPFKEPTTYIHNIIIINFICARDPSHQLDFIFTTKNNIIQKIGQYPSIADLIFPEIEKYKTILAKEDLKEFKRAIGLVSHGIGIGSFVYLRRIFEKLIKNSHDNAKQTKGEKWDEEKYKKSSVDKQIEILKDFLPEFMVEHKKLYSILSKGIHELSEEECLKYFDTVKVGIELILDEKLEEESRKDKIKEATKKLGNTFKNLK